MSKNKLIELDDALGRATVTEQFLLNLHRSSELLKNDQTSDARKLLDDAFQNQKNDASGQATLALVYFKLGLYPRALRLYEKLISDFPSDPVLMLNLSLVHFKLGQTAEAKEILEDLIAKHPDYRKAQGYLGLAYQRMGDFEGAYNAFKNGGVDHMAERMARFIEPEVEPMLDGDGNPQDNEVPSIPPPPPGKDATQRDSVPPPELQGQQEPFLATPPFPLKSNPKGVTEPLPISELVQETKLDDPLEGRFLVSESGYLLTNVAGRVYVRLNGLHFCSASGLSYTSLKKRQRGLATEEIFGNRSGPIYSIEGSGRLGFHPRSGTFCAVSLDNDVAYIKEDLIFAFDPELDYENGRLPGSKENVVHFRGRGSVVMKTPTAPHSLRVTPDKGVIIPTGGLTGWFGHMLPRATQGSPFDANMNALEFTGEGILLFCLS